LNYIQGYKEFKLLEGKWKLGNIFEVSIEELFTKAKLQSGKFRKIRGFNFVEGSA